MNYHHQLKTNEPTIKLLLVASSVQLIRVTLLLFDWSKIEFKILMRQSTSDKNKERILRKKKCYLVSSFLF